MTQPPALPTSKRDKIIYLLDHWDDIHDPNAASPNGSPGDGSNTPHLAGMSRHYSVLELRRCLDVLKQEHKLWHDHLKAFHGAEWRIAHDIRRSKSGKVVMKRDPVVPTKLIPDTIARRHRRMPQWVKMGYVRSAQFRLEELYHGDPTLPEDFEWALTKTPEQVAVLERRRADRHRARARAA